jgi:hypothetical protein
MCPKSCTSTLSTGSRRAIKNKGWWCPRKKWGLCI